MGESEDGYSERPVYAQTSVGLPASTNVEVVRELIKNKSWENDAADGDHPEQQAKNYWSIFNKSLVLSNLSQMEIEEIRWNLKALDCLVLISKSEEDMSINDIKNEILQEIFSIAQTSRARDGFERKEINTSTQQSIVGSTAPQSSPGWGQRIVGGLFGNPIQRQ